MYSVLIVDDSGADINGLVENIAWSSLDCNVVATAKDGNEGVEIALKIKPDIIITDILMPRKDGIAMSKEILSNLPQTKIIYMSCFDEFSYVKSALDDGILSYVLKPIKIPEIENAIIKATSLLTQAQQHNKLTRHRSSLIENFFLNLLFDSKYDYELAMLLDVPIKDRFRIAVFEYDLIDQTSDLYSQLSELKDLCTSIASSEHNYFLELGINLLVCLVHENSMTENQFSAFVSKVKTKAPYYHKFSSAIYSKPAELQELANLFLTLTNTSSFAMHASNISDLYKRLSLALISGTTEDIKSLTEEVFPQNFVANPNYLKTVSLQITSMVLLILNENGASCGDIFEDEFLIWNKLIKSHNSTDARKLIDKLLVSAQNFFSAKSVDVDKYDSIATKIKNFIELNFSSYTITQDAAEAVHLSSNYANSVFKKATGHTLYSYALYCRLEKSKQLMNDSALSISDIATAVGFTSNAHFSSAFKKHTNLSPSQYRNARGEQ